MAEQAYRAMVPSLKEDEEGGREDAGKACEVPWQEMLFHGRPVPRLVCIQGERRGEDGAVPLYRHPVDEQPPVHDFSPSVAQIVQEARQTFGHPFNHALIQVYRSGQDSINQHADKTLDIVPGSPIVNVSLGSAREFLIRSKAKLKCGSGPEIKQRITLLHNSALAFGLETNRFCTHQIAPDKRPPGQRRPEETAWDGVRISLTLRVVGTFLRPQDGRIFGQGAKYKSAEDLDAALASGKNNAGQVTGIEEVERESARMMEAFRQENRDPNFDWAAFFGEGFDLIAPMVEGSAAATAATAAAKGDANGEAEANGEACVGGTSAAETSAAASIVTCVSTSTTVSASSPSLSASTSASAHVCTRSTPTAEPTDPAVASVVGPDPTCPTGGCSSAPPG